MHHPDICQILLIINDYFLLSDNEREPAQIDIIVGDPANHRSQRGISITQVLSNGRLKIYIYGANKDSDEITFKYIADSADEDESGETIEIECGAYADNIRDAVRTVLKLDRGIDD